MIRKLQNELDGRRDVRNCGIDQPVKWPTPTNVMPGTPEKIAILAERAERGFVLHHPHDSHLDEFIHAKIAFALALQKTLECPNDYSI
ncbi:MAG: hypothetical protein R3E01_14675 [Pirellulaceae bacterium]|nr:hypothetical protein [Planctomycetales bacterium]